MVQKPAPNFNGQKVPESSKQTPDKVERAFSHGKDELMSGQWNGAWYGESGQSVSELLPHTARPLDELCQLRSMLVTARTMPSRRS